MELARCGNYGAVSALGISFIDWGVATLDSPCFSITWVVTAQGTVGLDNCCTVCAV